MRKAWGVLIFVVAAAFLLRMAWDALQPLLPVILIVIVIVVPLMLFRKVLTSLLRRRTHF